MSSETHHSRAPEPTGGRPFRATPTRRGGPGGWGVVLVLLVVAVLVIVVAVVATGTGSGTRPVSPKPSARALDPSYFAAGACVEFAPLDGDRHTVVFLDAGHGGVDPGAIGETESGATIEEAQETLPTELDAATLLRQNGFTVVVSRTRQTTVLKLKPADVSDGVLSLLGAHDDVAARDRCANMAHASALVGIYFDSGSSPSNAGSVTVYDTARPFTTDNQRLATLVQNDVLADMNAQGWQIPDEGTLPDNNFGSLVPTDDDTGLAAEAANYDHLLLLGPAEAGYFSTPSQMPGAVIEPLFITDPFEGSIAASSRGQHVIADGIAQAVEQYFGPPGKNAGRHSKADRSRKVRA